MVSTEKKILDLVKEMSKSFDRTEMKRLMNTRKKELDSLKCALVDKLKELNVDIELDTFDPVLFTIVSIIFNSHYFSIDGMIQDLKLHTLLEKDAELLNYTHDYDGEKYIPNLAFIEQIREKDSKLAKNLEKYINDVQNADSTD